jgi:Leucine-rich repeat (LRR) protein
VKDSVSDFFDSVIKKDQQQEQGFEVTKLSLYDQFNESAKRIDLSDKGLLSVPDICELLDVDDHKNVWWLDVSNNNIRILNTDLSCLTYLKSLDLSHNEIQAVQTL